MLQGKNTHRDFGFELELGLGFKKQMGKCNCIRERGGRSLYLGSNGKANEPVLFQTFPLTSLKNQARAMAPTAAEAKPEDPVIEDAGSDSEDEMPGLEDTAAGANDENADTNAAAGADDGEGKGKQSRGEKKARKTLSKLGLKQVRSEADT